MQRKQKFGKCFLFYQKIENFLQETPLSCIQSYLLKFELFLPD